MWPLLLMMWPLMMIMMVLVFFVVDLGQTQSISFDSSDDTDGSAESWEGFTADAKASNGAPLVVLQNKQDLSYAMCIEFVRTFESASADFDADAGGFSMEVDDSEIDFSDENAISITYEKTSGETFMTTILSVESSARFTSLVLDFTVEQGEDEGENFGLKYSYELVDYVWTSDSAFYVVELLLEDCSDEFGIDSDDDDSDESEDSDTSDSDTDTVRRRLSFIANDVRRRLSSGHDDDEDSDDDSDGISSVDSDEVIVSVGEFINTPIANCMDEDGMDIAVDVVYYDGSIFLVFENFYGCSDMFQDPWTGVNSDLMDTAHALLPTGIAFFITTAVSVIYAFLYF